MIYNKEHKRYISKDGLIFNVKNDKLELCKTSISNAGYEQVCTGTKTGNRCSTVHRLVYTTFIGPVPDGYEIDHIDDNRTNNKLSNLQLLTHLENTRKIKHRKHSKLPSPSRGTTWYTNGILNVRCKSEDIPPEGFTKGFTKFSCK